MSQSSARALLKRASPCSRSLHSFGPAVPATPPSAPRASTSRNTIEHELQREQQQQMRRRYSWHHIHAHQSIPSQRIRQFSASSRSRRGRTVQEAEDEAESGGNLHVSEQLLRKYAEVPPNYGMSECAVPSNSKTGSPRFCSHHQRSNTVWEASLIRRISHSVRRGNESRAAASSGTACKLILFYRLSFSAELYNTGPRASSTPIHSRPKSIHRSSI
jgi:hypothetical protein